MRAGLSADEKLERSVILANVAKNHSYPIAEAAAQAGYL